MNLRCIVFDLDDTLYLERDYVWSGFGAVEVWANRKLGLRDFRALAWALFQRGERRRIFDKALTEAGITPDRSTIQSMVNVYRGHMPDICLAADASECLRYLSGRDRLALVSDGPQQSQRNKINALGVEKCFEAMVLTSELGEGYAKPHPKAFFHIQKVFGLAARQCTYVADNPKKDFIGPRSLGWQTIRVRRPEGLHFTLEAGNLTMADVEVPDLSTVSEVITRGLQVA